MDIKRIFLLAAILFLAACASSYVGIDQPEPGADLLGRAEKSFRSKDYRAALSHYDAYLSRYPAGMLAPDAILREGEIYHLWKDYRTARQRYQDLIDRYGDSRLASQAMIGVLRSFYDEKKYPEVIRHADAFLRRHGGVERPAGIFVILGDTYMATDSPVNAVYFYAKANEHTKISNKNIILRLKSAVSKLSVPDIMALSERVTDRATRGYLLYALGLKEIDEGRHEDAARSLSQFAATFPEHEYAGEARRMLRNLEGGASVSAGAMNVIGCLLPLTGAYAHYGQKALRAIELALSEAAPSGNVGIVIKDTCSDPQRAALAVQEMARENVTAIIGPIITADTAATAAQSAGIPMVALTQKDDITKIGNYIFRNFLTPQMQVGSLVSYAMKMKGVRRFAVLYPEEKYGAVFLAAFRREVQSRGGILVAAQSYDVKTSDFSTSIKHLMRYSGIEALFIPDGPEKAGLIVPQLAYHGLSGVQLLGTNLWNSEKLIQSAGRYAQAAVFPEIFYPASPLPEVRNFVRVFRMQFDETPGFIEALAYDTAMMLVETFQNAPSGGRSAVRDALAGIQFFHGVTGATTFDETGDATKKLVLLTIGGDRFEVLGLW